MKSIRSARSFRLYIGAALILVILVLIAALFVFLRNYRPGSARADPDFLVGFTRERQTVTQVNYTGLVFGPDSRLYGGTLLGDIYVWDIEEDGTLINERRIYAQPGTAIIGMAFDPASTPDNPILWFTENVATAEPPPIFSGKINQFIVSNHGQDDESWEVRPAITGLPRSLIDHLVNGIAFGPDGALYIAMGSNNTMGDRDPVWMRPESLLSGSILRLDTELLFQRDDLPLDVTTGIPEEDGYTLTDERNYGLGAPELADFYDPLAEDAPLTIYATGFRNHYDLVWHSNGRLYTPVNGSGSAGYVPGTPDPLPLACEHRLDVDLYGPYTGPQVPARENLPSQPDYLMNVVQGGYYGHPNPTRCEWVAYGGNPTAGPDPGQTGDHYPVGTLPDRNWRRFAYDFGDHRSANGIIEYQSDAFNGQLQGKLLVVRYASGQDILILEPDASGNIIGAREGIPGLTYLRAPLDLTEDTRSGNIYVSEFGDRTITLLRPLEGATPEQLARLRQETEILKFNERFLRGLALTGVAGMVSLSSLIVAVVLYRRDARRPRKWLRYLFPLAMGGIIAVGLLYVAFDPFRSGWWEFRNQFSSTRYVEFQPQTPDEIALASLPPDVTPIARTYDPALVTAGGEIYQRVCVVCHGADGSGVIGIGVPLVNNVFILTHEDDALVEFLTVGRLPWDPANTTGMTMPAKGGDTSLTDEQLLSVVAYLRSLTSGE